MKKCMILLLAALLAGILPLGACAAEDVSALVAGLPTVEEFKAMNADDQLDAYNRTQAAYDAYMALPEEERAQAEGAQERFEALFAYFNTLVAPAAEAETGVPAANAVEEPANDSLTSAITTALSVVLAVFLLRNLKKKKL